MTRNLPNSGGPGGNAAESRYDATVAKLTDHEIECELANLPPRNRSAAYLDALRAELTRRNAASITVRLEHDDLDGGWVASVLELPGCLSEGENVPEALRNIADAYAGVTDTRPEHAACRWYVVDHDTGRRLRGPYDRAATAGAVRAEMERYPSNAKKNLWVISEDYTRVC